MSLHAQIGLVVFALPLAVFVRGIPRAMPADVVPECQVRKIHGDGKETLCS
jgi:hypothetical protein